MRVSKNSKIIIGVLIGLFFLFGCIGSGSSDNQAATPAAPGNTDTQTAAVTPATNTEVQAPAEVATPVNTTKTKTLAGVKTPEDNDEVQVAETPAAQIAETPEYDDQAWILYTIKYCDILSPEFTSASNSLSSLDFDTTLIYSQLIINDTNRALEENKKYHVSPKYQAAYQEWEASLQDYNQAGEYLK